MSEPYDPNSARAVLGRHGEECTFDAIWNSLRELGIDADCNVILQSSSTEGLPQLDRARKNQEEGDHWIEYHGLRLHIETKSTQKHTKAGTSSYPNHEYEAARNAGLISLVVCHGFDENYKSQWMYVRTFASLEFDRLITEPDFFTFDGRVGLPLSLTERIRRAFCK